MILVATIAIPTIYGIIAYPKFGIIVLLCASYLMVVVARAGVTFPLGTILDGIQLLLLISFLLKQKHSPDWKIYRTAISVSLVVWIIFNFLEIFNPAADSLLAWLYTVRTIAIISLSYFVFSRFISSVNFITLIIKLWIFLSLLGAIYGFKQEFVGFSSAEQAWLDSSPRLTELYFINGIWRKFSFFTDPVTFAYNMVISSILCFSLLTGPFNITKKIILALLGILFFIAMLYSGTRGAYVLMPIAFAFYSILNFSRKLFLGGLLLGCLVTLIIILPNSNATIIRFQSAFKPTNDPSFTIRTINQKKIQPYILSHPIGGGLGSTGTWGQRFSPNSYLANFPPDSGYVRVAVEQGWIGLFIFCSFIFIVLKTGIDNYFIIKDPRLKSYSLAMLLIVFALSIGNYPQEALVQYPTNVYFYLVIALIDIMLRLDKKNQLNYGNQSKQ